MNSRAQPSRRPGTRVSARPPGHPTRTARTRRITGTPANAPDDAGPGAEVRGAAPGGASTRRMREARWVLLPRLGAPGHHRAAVAGLMMFVRDTPPAGLVFLDAPPATGGEAWEAFTDVVAGFRAVYAGPIGVHQPHRQHDAPPPEHSAPCGPGGLDGLGGLEITPLPALAPVAPGWVTAPPNPARAPGGVIGCATRADTCIVTASTGRMRLTARAEPGTGGRARSWIAMECGTLAADPKPGTLGFALLTYSTDTTDGTTAATAATAYPIWMDPDGSFTHHGIRHGLRDGPRDGPRDGAAAPLNPPLNPPVGGAAVAPPLAPA